MLASLCDNVNLDLAAKRVTSGVERRCSSQSWEAVDVFSEREDRGNTRLQQKSKEAPFPKATNNR